ncbi:hypothetical protein ACFY00_31565 [Kitasatospora sp. NPDC001540]|uniref:hypothetical protein n=1 Tax=Kitasatospora sp. NPDC001540 TaxID=3364014 RepID=UPI00367AEDB6
MPARGYFVFLDGELDAAAPDSVAGARPSVAWATAPWFGGPRGAAEVAPEAPAEAALRIGDGGHPLDAAALAGPPAPWAAAASRLRPSE